MTSTIQIITRQLTISAVSTAALGNSADDGGAHSADVKEIMVIWDATDAMLLLMGE